MTAKGAWALIVAGLLAAGGTAPATGQTPPDPVFRGWQLRAHQALVLAGQWRRQRHLNHMIFPLLVAARDLCPGQAAGIPGFSYTSGYAFAETLRPAAREVLGVDERLRIIDVVPGGPAERAGLKVGDHWVALDGRPLPAGPGAVDVARRRLAEALARGGPVRLGIEGDWSSGERVLTPERGCAYRVFLVDDDSVNAFADGRRVGVTSGTLRFLESDRELAVVLAHEIAHNALGRMKDERRTAQGSRFDLLAAAYEVDSAGTFDDIGTRPYGEALEAEADYVGLYIMARAGMDVRGATHVWRRMAEGGPGAIQRPLAAGHPSAPARYLAIEGATREILEKQAAGRPLLPEIKRVKAD